MKAETGVPDAVERVAGALERLHLRYAFGGALAQNYWGVIRATQDVDLLALVPALRWQELVDVLLEVGFRGRAEDGSVRDLTVSELKRAADERGLFAIWLDFVKVEVFVPVVPLQDRIDSRHHRRGPDPAEDGLPSTQGFAGHPGHGADPRRRTRSGLPATRGEAALDRRADRRGLPGTEVVAARPEAA